MDAAERLTDPKIIKALAHPLRGKLLTLLDSREASPSQLAKELEVPLGTVSYHVRTLYKMGLLRLVREEPQRGAIEHYYTTADWIVPKNTWAALPIPLKRAVSSSMIAQVGEEVSLAASNGGFDEPYSAHLSRSTLRLDEEGARQLAEEVNNLMNRAASIEAESKERSGEVRGANVRGYELALMLFGTMTT